MAAVNTSLWFSMLASIAFKSTVMLAAVFALTLVMRKRSAAARHIMWSAAAAALVALPLLSVAMPDMPALRTPVVMPDFSFTAHATPSVRGKAANVARSGEPAPRSPASRTLDWQVIVIAMWAAGAAAMFIQTTASWLQIRRLRRSAAWSPDQALADGLAKTLGISHPVEVLETEECTVPMTFGMLRPAVLMPRSARTWSEDRRRVVLLHELGHVRRGDGATHMLARLALVLNWWNPLAWVAWRKLLKESERAADDVVLSSGAQPAVYAGHLLDVARAMQETALGWAATAMARPSQLEERLRAILDSRVNRKSTGRASATAAAALIAGVLMVPVAGVRAQQESDSSAGGVDALITTATAQKNFQVLEQRAAAFAAEGQYEAARKLLDASVAIRQQTSAVDYGVGLIMLGNLEKKRNRFADAESFYSKAAQVLGDKPEAARALINLGIAALHDKNPEQAITYFQTAQRLNPSQSGAAWMWMGIARERQNNKAEAEAMYRSALSIEGQNSPEAATIMELYGKLLIDTGRQTEAQPLIERARALRKAIAPATALKHTAGVYRIGGDVRAPKPLQRTEPEYTEEARLAKYQGTAVLSVEIGVDGVPRNIQVVRGLGLGLDDNAVAAVSTWRFQPGTKDGAAVPVAATIEVNFRLM